MRRSVERRLCLLAFLAALGGCDEPPARALRAEPPRTVVMAPAAAEMLEALDATEHVVGIGDFVERPASLTALPRVGAYNAPSVERVLELRGTLFLTAASEAAVTAHRRLEQFGVRVSALDTSTYDGVFASLAEVGRLMGRERRAAELEREMRSRLERIRQTAANLPRRRVLFVVGRDPLFVAGPGSHVDEMIRLVGGVNVLQDASASYQRASIEAVLERMPEVIVDTSDNGRDAELGRNPGSWGQWEFLPAVAQRRVYHVSPELLVIPGIRLPEMTELMARLVQPEAFGEVTDDDLIWHADSDSDD